MKHPHFSFSNIVVIRCPTELCKDCAGEYSNITLGNKLICKCLLCPHGSKTDPRKADK